jgi:hypothetical protein
MNRHVPLPIKDLFQIKTTCDDCGRRQVYGRREIASEQAQLGLATPEELGSHFTCSYCKDRGGDGKNLSVRLISKAGVVTDVIKDLRPVSSLNFVSGECPRCGHEGKIGPEKLVEYPAEVTVHQLWCRAVCQDCRADGIPSPRMTITVDPPFRATAKPQEKVKWSTSVVFGEDRSSPFPNLPPSRLMR